jgi:LDH2 family malate/lactate/ureidoglycolate dehydrogenase
VFSHVLVREDCSNSSRAEIKVVKETYTMALINGGASLGQVVAYTAMEMAVEKAGGRRGCSSRRVRNSHH